MCLIPKENATILESSTKDQKTRIGGDLKDYKITCRYDISHSWSLSHSLMPLQIPFMSHAIPSEVYFPCYAKYFAQKPFLFSFLPQAGEGRNEMTLCQFLQEILQIINILSNVLWLNLLVLQKFKNLHLIQLCDAMIFELISWSRAGHFSWEVN